MTLKELIGMKEVENVNVIIDNDVVQFYLHGEKLADKHPNTIIFDALYLLGFKRVEAA